MQTTITVDYEFTGPSVKHATEAADAVSRSMELYNTTEMTREVVKCAVLALGDSWDEKSLRAVLDNCSFYEVE